MELLTREREVEAYLRRKVEDLGLDCKKFVPDQDPGMPDRVILLPDRQVLWVETKRPKGGRVAEIQRFRHRKLRDAGHEVVIVWTKAQADELVEDLRERLRI